MSGGPKGAADKAREAAQDAARQADTEAALDLGVQLEGVRAERRALARENRQLKRELAEARKAQGVLDELDEIAVEAAPIKRNRQVGKHQAAAVFVFSDWHAGETVNPRQVNGVNAYDTDIFRERAELAFQHGLELVELHRNGVHIETLVVGLVGDMMTGFIHEDLKLTNGLTPQGEILALLEVLTGGFNMLLAEGGFERILVPCAYGNHGRSTIRPSHAAGAATSWEVMIYKMLAERFASDERIEFVIPEGPMVYTTVLGTTIRWTHGDGFKFAGGVGGVLIPGRKAVAKWDTIRPADQTVIGHWHQLTWDRSLVVNGSLIGMSAYGMHVGHYEPPQQAFFLVDEKYGRTALHPILVESERQRRRARRK